MSSRRRVRRKFRKTEYKNYQGSDYRVGRLKQGVSLYQLRKTPENLLQYAFSKSRYNIATYSLNQLKTRGASQEDIIRYYERERQLYTGEYEVIRLKQYIENYKTALRKQNASDETLDRIDDLFENKDIRTARYISTILTPINLHYKPVEDDIDEFVNEELDFIESMLER